MHFLLEIRNEKKKSFKKYFVVVVQLLSRVRLCDLWTVACQAPVSFTISQSLLKFLSTESVTLSAHPILCCPLLPLPSVLPGIPPSLVCVCVFSL